MDKINILENSIIFKDMEQKDIIRILDSINYTVKFFHKDENIAIEEDPCNSLGIIINGNVEIQKIFASGKAITIDRLKCGNIFGEVIIFSNMRKYPATITAVRETSVMFISREEILKLCSLNSKFLNNFMGLLSNKILMLNKKVKNLSYNSIRQKISSYLLEEYNKIGSLNLKLNISRKEMAELLGVPRPSLSREMIKMKEEGLIDFNKNVIKILDEEALEDVLI
ncbi:Crp/Fnr family transcriptional regulator [Clostridium cochlearium]|uniref:Transcriptional regulatory protein n=1 Tax=Clostridium cochlearium TaxID=1494 RepID=A0A240AL87_CLOCO|nr:Crp/Fnr family transcriptional regulator [Clostridium cochlearium]MBV1819098.1 Crp/Fnr family transcriptional regulator [Bacteroidales bacterium MSK.15.36]NSJ90943.1 Crp/Fnr family transcriptional regulator [Coprococcus sp. MSK.21.13]MBE6064553.1 Crp/Fnr family transcriptional regulator [Clostridium cochlearium]MBU5268495.1 Crp/Fnr family transcriptional regulator [Clostridium cochlearium]MCG4571850.1 Crp/Fnr family transcriptional regulator [Clostridium cochlearium]